ncbi:MAG: hypothetical protein H6839_12100 [Planctomycetes bacterium]|nr:hypothetical protein [Planctomycetota bacterium]
MGHLIMEFNYPGGRTDSLALFLRVGLVAFEAKLTNWRKALQQAYRNTAFADRSFVVLPERTAQLAMTHQEDFLSRHVGIISVSRTSFNVLLEAPAAAPVRAGVRSNAISRLAG